MLVQQDRVIYTVNVQLAKPRDLKDSRDILRRKTLGRADKSIMKQFPFLIRRLAKTGKSRGIPCYDLAAHVVVRPGYIDDLQAGM